MKKRLLLLITALMVALLIVSSSAVAAPPNGSGAIDCDLDIEYNGTYWFGEVTGSKCSVAGEIRCDPVGDEYTYPGKTMHFVETCTIWPSSGGFIESIEGKDWGVWNMSTFKFRANGWVRDASDEWAHLVGAHYHELGVTSDPFGPDPLIVYPGAWMKIAPGNRPPDSLP